MLVPRPNKAVGFQLSAAAAGIAVFLYSSEVFAQPQQEEFDPAILEAYGLTAEELRSTRFPLNGVVVDPNDPQEIPEEDPGEGCEWDDLDCEDQDSSGAIESQREFEQSYFDQQLVTIGNWPEWKEELEMRCVRIIRRNICTKWPIIYHRTSRLWLLARVYYPDGGEQVARTCLAVAAAAGLVSLTTTMQIDVATSTLLLTLRECAKIRLPELVLQFDLELKHTIEPGEWQKI